MRRIGRMQLMECVEKLLGMKRSLKYDKKYRLQRIIECKQAELCGDYEKAYHALLEVLERELEKPMRGWNFTMIYNIPVESASIENSSVKYATAAVYNLWRMGFSHPAEHFEDYSARFRWGRKDKKFTLRTDRKHEHLGELRIISKDEYDNPIKHRPEFKCCSYNKPSIGGESWLSFYSGEYDDMIINYKVLKREWKHDRVYLECDGHYYEYSWQFSQG